MRYFVLAILACTSLLAAPQSWAQEEETKSEFEQLNAKRYALQQDAAKSGTLDTEATEALLSEVDDYNSRFKNGVDGFVLAAKLLVLLERTDQADTQYRVALMREPYRVFEGMEWAAIHHETNPARTMSVLRELMAAGPDKRAYPLALYGYLEVIDPAQVDDELEGYLKLDKPSIAAESLVNAVGQKHLDRGIELGTRLLEAFPDSDNVKIEYMRRLRQAARFKDAVNFIEEHGPHLLMDPGTGIMYSDCLYADHQFDASIRHLIELQSNEDNEANTDNLVRNMRLDLRPAILESWKREEAIRSAEATAGTNPRVSMTINSKPVLIELYENSAPATVANFLALVRDGHYENTWFHNVAPAFMSQGGIPADMSYPSYHGPGYSIINESSVPGARDHFSGSIAMPTISPDKLIGSQFYITHAPTMHLNGMNPVFGHVVEGLDVIRSMRGGERIDSIEITRAGIGGIEFEILLPDGSSTTHEEWKSSQAAQPQPSAP